MKDKLITILRVCFYFLIKPFLWVYSVVFQHVRFRRNGYKIPKGPVLFLSNHVTNWDPFYLNCMFFSRIIRFIAHDELFSNKFFAWFSKNILGEVCRGRTDESISDILEMRRLVKSGATLGLYPEGDIDMFGRTLPIGESVAKFARLLGVPVVLTKIQGACIRAPRWADKPRRAKITYSITDVIYPNELKSTPVKELYERILRGIVVDEYSYQKEIKVKQLPATRRAEWLELGLFYCPNCGKLETLTSKGDKIYCKKCNFKAKYNRYSMLEPVNGSLPFQLLTEWDDEQKNVLCERLDLHIDSTPFLVADNLDYYQIEQTEYFKKPICKANLKLYKDRLEIAFDNGAKVQTIQMKDIRQATLQYKDVLEIQYDEFRIRFQATARKWSAYLYALAINHLTKAKKYYLP